MKWTGKQAASLLLAVMLLLLTMICAVAEPEESGGTGNDLPEDTSGTSEETNPAFQLNHPAMAYCVDTEQVLFENRADEIMAAGVINRLCALMVAHDLLRAVDRPMTTTVTLEAEWLKDSYIAGDRSTPYIGLKAGEEYTLEYLFTATLVAGASDACAALVRYCASQILQESEQGFLARMNEKAAELGMTNTRFTTTTGKGGATSMTTVRDAMKLVAAFYSYNDLVIASDCASYGSLKNKNYLLCDNVVKGYLNKDATGLIAGQASNEGGYALVTYSVKEGSVYAYLLMGGSGERIDTDGKRWFDPGNVYEEMNKLIPWALSSYSFMTLCKADDLVTELRMGDGAEADHLILVPEKGVEMLVFDPDESKIETRIKLDSDRIYEGERNGKKVLCIDAPVKRGEVLGTITYLHKGEALLTLNLVARDTVETDELRQAMSRIRSFLFDGPMSKIILIVAILVGLWILLALALFVLKIVNRFRKRKSVNKL